MSDVVEHPDFGPGACREVGHVMSALPAPEGLPADLPADLRLIAADLDRLLTNVGELVRVAGADRVVDVRTRRAAHDLYVAVYQAAMTAVRLQGGAS